MTKITVGVSDFITGKWYIFFPMLAVIRLPLLPLEEDRARGGSSGTASR